jgi:two-component system sensor histidine kinase AlgZ
MSTTKGNWLFSLLWINFAVAIVVFIRVIGNQITSGRDLLYELGYSLIFANLTGVLGFFGISAIAARVQARKIPLVPTLFLCILVFVPVGCLLAQTLLMAFGVIAPHQFWPVYLNTLRVSLPLSAVFGLGALVHAMLRERLRLTEEKLHEKEVGEERAKKLAAEARLSSLESRIHPHFLFNTLNSISSAIAVNPAKAEQIVGKLAVLLRASLDNSNQTLIPLQEELAMVESYLEIEKSRFGDKLRSSAEVPDDLRSARVPPMSVQTLVENAVKHGVTPQRSGGEILVAASKQDGDLRIEVRDSGPGFDMTAIPAGHGLDNLVERLDALFGDRARLNVFRRNGLSVVEMVLPRL